MPRLETEPVTISKSNNVPHKEASRRISCAKGTMVTLWTGYGVIEEPPVASSTRKHSVTMPNIMPTALLFVPAIFNRRDSTVR